MTFKLDFAISFAGEVREIAEKILRAPGFTSIENVRLQ